MANHIDESYRDSISISSGASAPVTVLLVMQNVVMRTLLSQLIGRLAGPYAQFANTAAEALAALSAQRFDVVLVDLDLEDFEGSDGARPFAAQVAAAGPRLIGLTGLEADTRRTQAAGMDECIGKPPSLAELRRVLTDINDKVDDFNPVAWAELQQMFGPSGAAEMARVLAVDLPEQRARLQAALKTGDMAALQPIAHRLRGACQQIGAEALADLCTRTEQAATASDQAAASRLGTELLRRYAALVDDLQHA